MDNRPSRSKLVGPKQPSRSIPNSDDTENGLRSHELTPVPIKHDSREEDYHLLGSTRIMANKEHALFGKTHSTEETEIHEEGDSTEKELPLLGEDFQLLKKLGEGAMGVVYLAHQINFDRQVALKVLFSHIAKNEKLVRRMEREALTMNQLEHPNIVESFGVGEAGGCHYFAMEFIDGDSLQTWLNRLNRFTVPDALAVTLDCARALDYAHAKGFVHRDIKPDNVIIDRKGTVKVADLGMVKNTLGEEMSLTQTGHAVGTPWYMPLEQAKMAKDADGRCDIYALGCMLYCLLTGNPPFNGPTIVEVIEAKEKGTFPPARSLNPEVPERLDLIILKMTAKLPRNRYQNCAELIKDLESLGLAGSNLEFLKDIADRPPPGQAAPKKLSSLDGVTNEWFVQVTMGEGKIKVLPAMTTSQIKKMLEEGTIHPTAKASRQPKEGFRALGTFKEFQGTALVKQNKNAADLKSAKFRTLYKKIEEKEFKRDQEEQKNDQTPAYYSLMWQPSLIVGTSLIGVFLILYILYRLFS